MDKIYKYTGNGEQLEKFGFITENNKFYVKEVVFDLEEDISKSMLKFYNDPKWKKEIYNKNKKVIYDTIGLKYDRKGNIIMSEKLKLILTTWLLEIDLEDGFIGFTSGDPFDRDVFYNCRNLNQYCSKELEEMKDFIQIVEV